MWRDFLRELSPEVTLAEPASAEAIARAEEALGVAFPPALRELLLETDGVAAEYGTDVLWPVERIVEDNLMFRSTPDFAELYMPFDALLFFGDAGDGDQFAFPVLAGEVRRPDVFVWDHENDSRSWAAGSLRAFYEQRLGGGSEG